MLQVAHWRRPGDAISRKTHGILRTLQAVFSKDNARTGRVRLLMHGDATHGLFVQIEVHGVQFVDREPSCRVACGSDENFQGTFHSQCALLAGQFERARNGGIGLQHQREAVAREASCVPCLGHWIPAPALDDRQTTLGCQRLVPRK